MGTPIVPGGYRAQLVFTPTTTSRAWSTKFDFEGPEESLADFAESFRARLVEMLTALPTGTSALFGTGTQLSAINYYTMKDPQQGIPETSLPAWPSRNVTPDSRAPGEVAAVASLRTEFLGRSYRGRQFWGSLSAGFVSTTTGLLSSTGAGQLQTFVSGFGALPLEGDFVHSIFRRIGGDPNDSRYLGEAVPVTAVLVDTFPDTQRRRGQRSAMEDDWEGTFEVEGPHLNGSAPKHRSIRAVKFWTWIELILYVCGVAIILGVLTASLLVAILEHLVP